MKTIVSFFNFSISFFNCLANYYIVILINKLKFSLSDEIKIKKIKFLELKEALEIVNKLF